MPELEQFSQTVEQQKFVEIITPKDLERLPVGICLKPNEEYGSGSEVLGEFIVNLARDYDRLPEYLLKRIEERANSPKFIVGKLMANCDGFERRIMEDVLVQWPDLCWFRGTDYYENDSGIVIPSRFHTIGANGLLGDANVLKYAKQNYVHERHEAPVLLIARLDSLLLGKDSGAIELGTEHDYDVTIRPRGKAYNKWAADNLLVCDLGNSAEDFDVAKRILASKAA